MPLDLILTANIDDKTAYDRLAKEMPDNVKQNEPGTITFRWMRDDDGKRAVFVDAYADANAFVSHYNRIKETGLLDRLTSCVDIDSIHAFGNLNDEAREILDQFGAHCYNEIGGFVREAPAAMH